MYKFPIFRRPSSWLSSARDLSPVFVFLCVAFPEGVPLLSKVGRTFRISDRSNRTKS